MMKLMSTSQASVDKMSIRNVMFGSGAKCRYVIS